MALTHVPTDTYALLQRSTCELAPAGEVRQRQAVADQVRAQLQVLVGYGARRLQRRAGCQRSGKLQPLVHLLGSCHPINRKAPLWRDEISIGSAEHGAIVSSVALRLVIARNDTSGSVHQSSLSLTAEVYSCSCPASVCFHVDDDAGKHSDGRAGWLATDPIWAQMKHGT